MPFVLIKKHGTPYTYHWERDDLVDEKVVVQAGEIGTSSGEEFQRRLSLDAHAIAALDEAQDVFMPLPNLLGLRSEVFEDCRWLGDGGQGRDVGDGGILGEDTGARIAQEAVVLGLERHFSERGKAAEKPRVEFDCVELRVCFLAVTRT